MWLSILFASSVCGQRLSFVHYTVDGGLPHELVHTIEQDHEGYMWFGTHGGLCRFDGRNFETFTDVDGCKLYHIWAMHLDDRGRLWIGTRDNGLVVYEDGAFRQIPGVGKRVKVVFQDDEGAIWIGTSIGLYRYVEGELFYFSEEDGIARDHINAISQDHQNTLWFGTQNGLFRYEEGAFIAQALESGLEAPKLRVIRPMADGSVWLGTATSVYKMKGAQFSRIPCDLDFSKMQIRFMEQDRRGEIWMGTSIGLFKYVNGKLLPYGVGTNSRQGGCHGFFEDREGNLWIGTTYGVSMLRNEAFVSFLDEDIQSVVSHAQRGEIWAASARALYRFRDGLLLPVEEGYPEASISCMLERRDGTVLVGTRGSGIFRYADGDFLSMDYAAPVRGMKHLKGLCEDDENALWIGSIWAGAGRFFEGAFAWFAKAEGLPDTHIHCILSDQNGAVWMGSFSGLSRFSNGAFTHFTTEDGLVGNEILALLEDDDGTLWIGTDHGLSYYDGERFRTFHPRTPFSSTRCRALVRSGDSLYIGTPTGLNRLNLKTGDVRIFKEMDGLAGSTIRPRAMAGDSAGGIWVGTTKGLTRFAPELYRPNLLAPPVYIQQISLLDGRLDPGQPAKLAHNNNHLTFEMVGLNYASAGEILFRYRLNGVGDDWIETAEPHVSFAFLPPGDYVFEVLARSLDGVWSEVPASFHFKIVRPYWAVWWFYVLLLAVLGGVSSLVYYLRMRRIVRHAAELGRLQSYLSNILDSMPSVLVGVDPEVNITQWNAEAERITGIPAERAVGRSLALIMPELAQETDRVKESIRSREVCVRSGLTRKVGETVRHEDVTIYPLIADGVDGAVIRVDDVTHITRLQEQFRQAKKMEAVGQLAGGIAHDFNNLLQGILGFSEMAMMDAEGHTLENLREAVASTRRASKLTRQLLAFSRRQVLEMRDVELNSVITTLIKMLRHIIGKHIELDVRLEEGGCFVNADASQIGQILTNLCVNARDAMPDGGVITIQTEVVELDEEFRAANAWVRPGKYVLLRVIDTGIGISDEILEKIFEPFFTTKEVGQGTGLGLSTIYGLVKQHAGFVDVRSEKGKGAEFRIYFPRIDSAPVCDDADSADLPLQRGSETILLAEDDQQVRHLTELTLKAAGYSVLAAKNGAEAMDIFDARSNEIDLALLDVVMPGDGGQTVHDHIKKVRPEAKVLFASGLGLEHSTADFIRDENLECISKPWSNVELLQRVRAILDGRAITS